MSNAGAPGLYVAGESMLHRLHPFTRLAGLLPALALIFSAPAPAGSGGWAYLAPAAVLGAALLLGLACGLGRRLLVGLRALLPLALALGLVHAWRSPYNLTLLGTLAGVDFYLEGLAYAVWVWLRLAAALAAMLLVVSTTAPAQLGAALAQANLPPRLVYLLVSPLLLLPQAQARIERIRLAQQARGLEVHGSLRRRAAALLPLVGPLVFSMLLDVDERSLALETRAFSAPGRRSSLLVLPDSPRQWWARRGLLLLALAPPLLRLLWAVLDA